MPKPVVENIVATVSENGPGGEFDTPPGQLVATAHVFFSKKLLKDVVEDDNDAVFDLLSEDIRRRVRKLLSDVPKDRLEAHL